jgi:hypothetical protein
MSGGLAMKLSLLAVVTAALAIGADKPAPPPSPFKFAVVNGQVAVTGKGFEAVAERAEVDTDKATLTLTGRAGAPVTIKRLDSRAGEPTVIRADRVIYRYGVDAIEADNVHSARGRE